MNEASKIPTESDWEWDPPSDYYEGDVAWARKEFFGKTIEELIPRFIELPLSASEDLYYMPKIPFRFYVRAFKSLFMTDELEAVFQAAGYEAEFVGKSLQSIETRSLFRLYTEFGITNEDMLKNANIGEMKKGDWPTDET